MLRRIFGSERRRRELNNEVLHNTYFSPNGLIESRRLRWAGQVARKGRRGMYVGFWWDAAAYMHPFFITKHCNMFSLKSVHTPLTAWELVCVGKTRHWLPL